MEVSQKQKQLLELINDPTINELLIGGSAGGGKTFTVCLAIVLLAKQYPGARFFVGRKTLKSLKQSTINSLLTKVHPMLGIDEEDFAFHAGDMTLDYINGSKLIFGELEKTPTDPDFARLGSLEIDLAFIEEAGEISLEAKNAIKSRVGRGIMNTNYGIPGKIILSCNPSNNFLKEEYYRPYKKLGAGGFQKWKIGTVEVNGERMDSFRAFLRASVYDNPFMPQSYIDNLKSLPEKQRRRLLDGDWDYADEEDSLFKSGLLEKAITYDRPEPNLANSWIGVDVSDKGNDRTVFTLIINGVAITQKLSSVQMNWEQTSEKPISRLIADELINFAMANGFTQQYASHITVECNGVGAALRDMLKERGWYLTEYTATHKTRSEGYYDLMLAMDSGELKILDGMNGLDDLERELSAHTYTMREQAPDIIKKEKIKMVIGRSPDLADSLMIAWWGKQYQSSRNPKRNANRIAW